MAEDSERATPDLLFLAENYVGASCGVVEFLRFEYRLCALIWLHRTLTDSVANEVESLRAFRQSGKHRIPGWEGESDDVLEESIGILEYDATRIGSGAIIAACSSALESLLANLLPETSSSQNTPRGLIARAHAVAAHWPDGDEKATMLEHVRWIAERRNSFAHRLTDDSEPWRQLATRYEFDGEQVEETFVRVGNVVSILADGYDHYIVRRSAPRAEEQP